MSKEEAEEIARGEKTEGEVLLLLLSFRGRRDEAEQQEALVVAVANISSSFCSHKQKRFLGKTLSKKQGASSKNDQNPKLHFCLVFFVVGGKQEKKRDTEERDLAREREPSFRSVSVLFRETTTTTEEIRALF